VRDVRDYRIHSSRSPEIITGGSAFNVKAESIRLGDFTQADVVAPYGQHSAETGQPFTTEGLEQVWHWTQGQPWLVNAIGYEVTFRRKDLRDRTKTIDIDTIDQAAKTLIQRRDTPRSAHRQAPRGAFDSNRIPSQALSSYHDRSRKLVVPEDCRGLDSSGLVTFFLDVARHLLKACYQHAQTLRPIGPLIEGLPASRGRTSCRYRTRRNDRRRVGGTPAGSA